MAEIRVSLNPDTLKRERANAAWALKENSGIVSIPPGGAGTILSHSFAEGDYTQTGSLLRFLIQLNNTDFAPEMTLSLFLGSLGPVPIFDLYIGGTQYDIVQVDVFESPHHKGYLVYKLSSLFANEAGQFNTGISDWIAQSDSLELQISEAAGLADVYALTKLFEVYG